jgi:hypothetical protein
MYCQKHKGLEVCAEAGIVLSPEDYLYSSAVNYSGRPAMLLDVLLIQKRQSEDCKHDRHKSCLRARPCWKTCARGSSPLQQFVV